MKIRVYCREEDAVGHDEGGWFKYEDAPEFSPKLERRMKRCGGCRNAFYNGRANISGNYCWSLDSDKNFKGRGQPKCWHRG